MKQLIIAKTHEYGILGLIRHLCKSRVQAPLRQALEVSYRKCALNSYSQYCEDLIADYMLGRPCMGSYIDIGANHPRHFNNTWRFYLKGWRGLNIEPNPSLCTLLGRARKQDLNLNIGVGAKKETLSFYQLEPHTLSTFIKAEADAAINNGCTLAKVIPVDILSLGEVIKLHQKVFNVPIDMLCIDVEGFELRIIDSYEWSFHRPKLVIIEKNRNGKEIDKRMFSFNYTLLFDNGTNGFYWDAI